MKTRGSIIFTAFSVLAISYAHGADVTWNGGTGNRTASVFKIQVN